MFILCLVIFCFFHLNEANCPNGSNQSLTDKTSCYFFVAQKSNFMAADQHCVGLGGNLVSIHNMFENVFLGGEANTVFTDSSNVDFWIGANNLLIPGTWSWMDGTSWDFTDWDVKQPINVSNTNCGAVIVQSQRWVSDDCIKNKPFVCLVKIHESTVAPLRTTTTTTTMTTTTKPVIHSPCPDTWTYFNGTKFCYKVFQKSTTWWDAEMTCVNEGSHLVSLHGWEENLFVTYLASYYSTNECSWGAQTWIGLSTKDSNGHWEWTDGTPFDYHNWEAGEPNNPGKENCADFWTGLPCTGTNYNYAAGELNNENCDSKILNFVCKKKSK